MTGRDKVSEIVLNTCKDMVGVRGQILSLDTGIIKKLDFSTSQIIAVVLKAGSGLMIKCSYSFLLQ
jgi:hypothetical protein